MIRKLLLIVLSVLGYARAAPTTYDLRQDGDLNVKVDLENFLVLVARPPSALDIFGSMSQLLAESRRGQAVAAAAAAAAAGAAGAAGAEAEAAEPAESAEAAEAATVISEPEPKSAPELAKPQDKSARSLEDVVASLRSLRDEAEAKNVGKYKLVESVEEPQSLKLVGDALENCGPGRSRDRQGVCQGDVLTQE